MKTADKIKRETISLIDRGIPSDSYFHLVFRDGSERTEHDTNWSDQSEELYVDHMNGKRVVRVSIHPVKSITVSHGNLQTTLELEDDEQVYQSIAMIAYLSTDNQTTQKVIGRRVGKVKNGRVIEERFLDQRTNEIIGFKF